MNLFGIESKKTYIETPAETIPRDMFSNVTIADSSYYQPYKDRPYNPSDLWQKRGDYSLYDEMREDDQISALLSLKKFFILSGERIVESSNPEITEFIEYIFDKCIDGLFERDLLEILTALDYGFSLTEKIFAPEETPFGKKIVLKKLVTRAPHTFEFDQDAYGNIYRIRQHTDSGADKIISPTKFIHYIYQPEFDNPYGNSEFNIGVYRAWFSKNIMIKFWNIYNERFGMPTAVGKYPISMEKEKNRLELVLKNLQAKTAIVLPEGIDVEFLKGQSGSGSRTDFEAAIDKYNTMIARKMLVPDLAGYSGSKTGGGSFALGKEQFNMFYNNLNHERNNLIRILNKEIVEPLVSWNFGKNEWAYLKYTQPNQDQKNEEIKIWLEAIKTGKVPATIEQINWFLNGVNAPELSEDDIDDLQNEEIDDKENDNDVETEMDDKVENDVETEIDDEREEEFAEFFREKTEYEKKVNFSEIDKRTKEIEKKYYEIIGSAYALMINAAYDDIKKQKIIENKKIDKINSFRLRNPLFNQMKKEYKKLLSESYNYGMATVSVEKKFIVDQQVGLGSDEVAEWLEQNAIYTNNTESENILKIIKAQLITSIRDGIGVAETIKLIDIALRGYDIKLGGAKLETTIRTVTATAFNESRKQAFQIAGDLISAYQFSAILDGRTSEICKKLDGKIFPPRDLSYYNPPLHFNCRSVVVPIYNGEEFDLSDMPATEMKTGGFLELK